MRYWLYKSEPGVFGIDHLAADGETIWDGVRSYQARNNLMAAETGDLVFFYHASAEPPGIAGLAEVIETMVTDPLQFDATSKYHDPTSPADDPRWRTVRLRFVEKFARFVPLATLRPTFTPEELPVLRPANRLSVTPVPSATAERILEMGRALVQ